MLSVEGCQVNIRPTSAGTLTITLNSDGIIHRARNAFLNLVNPVNPASTRAVTVTYEDQPPKLDSVSIRTDKPFSYSWLRTIDRDFDALFIFSEPVDSSTFTADDITITDGTGSATLNGSPYQNAQRFPRTFYLVPIRPTAEGTFTVTLSGSVTALNGDALPSALTVYRPPLNVTYDTTLPTVTLSAPATATGPYDVTFTISEPVIREKVTKNS